MLTLHHGGWKITMQRLANGLDCTTRTIHRNMSNELKKEKDIAAKKDSDNALMVSKGKSNQAVQKLILPIAWIVVGLPILWGISNALQKGIIIFH